MLLFNGEPHKLTKSDIDKIKKKYGSKVVFKLNKKFSRETTVFVGGFQKHNARLTTRYAPQVYPNTIRIATANGGEEEWTYFKQSKLDNNGNRVITPASTTIGTNKNTGSIELSATRDTDLLFFLLKHPLLATEENKALGFASHFHIVDKVQTAQDKVNKQRDYYDVMGKIVGPNKINEEEMRGLLLALGKDEALHWDYPQMQDYLISRAKDGKEGKVIMQNLGGPMADLRALITRGRLNGKLIYDTPNRTWHSVTEGGDKGEILYKVLLQGKPLDAFATYIEENPYKGIRDYLEAKAPESEAKEEEESQPEAKEETVTE